MYEELNKKMVEWAGFKLMDTQFYEHSFGNSEVETWLYPDGSSYTYLPDFTGPELGIAYCFKWLVPKLGNTKRGVHINLDRFRDCTGWGCVIEMFDPAIRVAKTGETVALALCLAIEKLIKVEGQAPANLT